MISNRTKKIINEIATHLPKEAGDLIEFLEDSISEDIDEAAQESYQDGYDDGSNDAY